jgi:hypothetical protein
MKSTEVLKARSPEVDLSHPNPDCHASSYLLLWEVLLFNVKSSVPPPPQGHSLKDSKVGRRLSLVVALNQAGAPRSMTMLHCRDTTCSIDKIIERSRNRNHGLEKVKRGRRQWIVGLKAM